MDYVAAQRMHDRADPRNEGRYLKSGFIGDFKESLIDAITTGYQGHPERARRSSSSTAAARWARSQPKRPLSHIAIPSTTC